MNADMTNTFTMGNDNMTLTATFASGTISANGTVTAIGTMQTKTGEVDIWYSLDGRRVEKPTKGIYVNKGKKVIIK